MSHLAAVLWDVDGTLAETERDGHRIAFNHAFEDLGLPWRWDTARYGALLRITGGRERLIHDMQGRVDAPADPAARDALARSVHAKKNAHYAEIVARGLIPLRDGVAEMIAQCLDRGVQMGIATTTSRSNVDALLSRHFGAAWARQFSAVVCGEDVERKKPDPAVYVQALHRLGIEAADAIALEDSPVGMAAARAAGIAVVITRSAYFEEPPFVGALAIGPGLHTRSGWWPALPPGREGAATVGLDDLEAWRSTPAEHQPG